jgi:hypothetical protein
MSKKKKGAPVVIVRKDKRMHKLTHLGAFALTGGLSGVVTATRAAQIGAYNARTRKLAEEADAGGGGFSEADHERARRAGQQAMAKLNAKAGRAEFPCLSGHEHHRSGGESYLCNVERLSSAD